VFGAEIRHFFIIWDTKKGGGGDKGVKRRVYEVTISSYVYYKEF
jgi:hypothetical protein